MNFILTKSNPDVWDLISFLDSGDTRANWTVAKTAKPGDTLFIGLSGPQAGIYAVAKIVSSPELVGGEDDEFTIEKGWFDKPRWRADVHVIKNLVNSPISDNTIENTHGLFRIFNWLHNQGTNTLLSEEEAKQLSHLAKL